MNTECHPVTEFINVCSDELVIKKSRKKSSSESIKAILEVNQKADCNKDPANKW